MRAVSGSLFFPRGGSAQVARALARELPGHEVDVTVVSGSGPGVCDARAFYSGLDVRAVDFAAGDAPHHPSYEDRPGAPDRVFAVVDDVECERHVAAWSRALERAGAAGADVLHLHHLTPLNEAAARVAPHVPVVGHLHGTELLMLERIAVDPPASWAHAAAWARRMRRWAARCERLLVLTEGHVDRAASLLGVERDRCVVVPNGFDPERFRPRSVDRRGLWQRLLVDHPAGWRPGEPEGSVRHARTDVQRMTQGVVIVAVGRFTEVKRVPLLVRAFERARRSAQHPAALVLVGGHPGEWEGEHPAAVVDAIGARDVYLTGWLDHALLPSIFNAADATVLASVREQFGLVVVESMACARPVVAIDRHGPAAIIDAGETGWLVEPDDEQALADALRVVIDDAPERQRRGAAAAAAAAKSYGWPAVAARVAETLHEAAGGGRRRVSVGVEG